METLQFGSKSPEKSSPSFPDVEDDDDDPVNASQHPAFPVNNETDSSIVNGKSTARTPISIYDKHAQQQSHHMQTDVNMLGDDEEEDGSVLQDRSYSLVVDSPLHPMDSSEKKVHWSNQNVEILLDCVEKHLFEFNSQKKHKQVWQRIGAEMQALGFTTEHCYNKWKNLRRDVRLMTNNPQRAVRNTDILMRVARLILVIYPNVDLATMQVGERNGRSAPATPGGSGHHSNVRTHHNNGGLSGHAFNNVHASSLHAPDSPQFTPHSTTTPSLTPVFHSFSINGSTKPAIEPDRPIPGAALFTNLGTPNGRTNNGTHCENNDTEMVGRQSNVDTSSVASVNATGQSKASEPSQLSALPFLLNPAAAALLVHSQLFNDLVRQQTEQQQTDQLAGQFPTANSLPVSNSESSIANGLPANAAPSTAHTTMASLASALINGLSSMNTPAQQPQQPPDPMSTVSPLTSYAHQLPPGSELAGVVERMRNEELAHMRLADLVSHVADELRAAGDRRRAALDQLLSIVQGTHVAAPNFLTNMCKSDAGKLV